MSRVNAVDPGHATGRAKELLELVHAKIGVTPNMIRGMANSPAVLESYLQMNAALEKGTLGAPLREQIALARLSRSSDPKDQAALELARALVEGRGEASDAEFARAQRAGFGDGEIGEIVANVALNLFTNYFNKAVGTVVDFPRVEPATRQSPLEGRVVAGEGHGLRGRGAGSIADKKQQCGNGHREMRTRRRADSPYKCPI